MRISRWQKSLTFVPLLAGGVVFALPLWWMVLTALKPIEQTATTPVTFLPRQAYALVDGKRVPVRVLGSLDDSQVRVEVLDAHGGSGRFVEVPQAGILKKIAPRWENFGNAITAMGYFPRYLRNTLVLCMLTVVGTVLSSATVAYGFSRVDWPGRDRVFILLLATMMVPFPVVMVPLYSMFRAMGWIGTLRPLWVPAFFASAFNVFLLRQFFMQLPRDLSESARLDGASELRIFVSIILPLSKPVLVVVALFQFLATWNDFLGPLIYLTDQKDFTLALGLQFFQSQHGGTQWHLLMAAATLVAGPVIVLYFFAQKFFVRGIAMTGLKA